MNSTIAHEVARETISAAVEHCKHATHWMLCAFPLQGHLAGAMMITTNSAAKVVSCSFISNSVINYGDFGGAIFHDYVSHQLVPCSVHGSCSFLTWRRMMLPLTIELWNAGSRILGNWCRAIPSLVRT